MEFVILNTVSQHGLSRESSIVWVKHSVEHLKYGKSHVNQFFCCCCLFDGVTVNPNVTKLKVLPFLQKRCAFISSDDHAQILSMPSNTGVKSLSFVRTPCNIRFHRNFIFRFFLTANIQALEPSIFS